LPKKIQALDTIYEEYWDNVHNHQSPLSYDEYYEAYFARHKVDILNYKKSSGFGKTCTCFEDGLKARIFRTWASLITQIQAGYVAQDVFKNGVVSMSTPLDRKGIDILLELAGGKEIPIQVKKKTSRPEIARMVGQGNNAAKDKSVLKLEYFVPSNYNDKTYKTKSKLGEPRFWVEYFDEKTGMLKMLDNGFVIFTDKFFNDLEITYDKLLASL